MMIRIKMLALPGIAALLAGCSGSGTGLTTGSLFGSSAESAPAVETPSIRAAQVAAVSARAAKCGYNYDPVRLKSGFLAAEARAGAPDAAKLEREYDTIRAKVASTIAADDDYCTDNRTREIKADLTRHMAGDYTPPASKKIDEKLLASGPRTREVLNPDFLNDKYAPKTKRVEE
jgi:hypothetical protein